MDLSEILKKLRDERNRLTDVIGALELYAAGNGKRRGRPPKWLEERRRRQARNEKEPASDEADTMVRR